MNLTSEQKKQLHTLSWWNKARVKNSEAQAGIARILDSLLGRTSNKVASSRPNSTSSDGTPKGQKLLHCPFAQHDFPDSRTRGKYPLGYPEGAIVHYTSGRPNQRLSDAMAYAAKQGFCYFVIDADGNIGQNFPLNRHGYHAGKSYHKDFGKYVSNRVVGIEVINAGLLSRDRAPWFDKKKPYPESQTRFIRSHTENQRAGFYQKYTPEQEEALIKLLLWLKSNNPSVFRLDRVLGHDEVSGPEAMGKFFGNPRKGYSRKQDPGGSLSMTMPALREHLQATYSAT